MSDSLSAVISSVNQLIAAAKINLKDSNSEGEKSRFSKEIDRLTEMKNEVEKEERKLTTEFRKRMNSWLKKGLIGSKGMSRRPDVLKRKAEEQKATSSKRPKLDDPSETVPFTTLPELLQDLIFEKFEYRPFTVFDQCSQFSHSMCVDTKLKFAFTNDWNEIENGRMLFKPMEGVRRNIVATMEQLSNVLLIAVSLRIKSTVTDDICLFMTSQLKTTFLTCERGCTCSQAVLDGLLQTLNVKEMKVNLRGRNTNHQWNVANLEKFGFSDARELDTAVIRKLKPEKNLTLCGSLTIDKFLDKLEAMNEDDDVFETNFIGDPSRREVREAMNICAELINGTVNCWEIKNKNNSEQPRLIVAIKSYAIKIIRSNKFSLDSLAEYPTA